MGTGEMDNDKVVEIILLTSFFPGVAEQRVLPDLHWQQPSPDQLEEKTRLQVSIQGHCWLVSCHQDHCWNNHNQHTRICNSCTQYIYIYGDDMILLNWIHLSANNQGVYRCTVKKAILWAQKPKKCFVVVSSHIDRTKKRPSQKPNGHLLEIQRYPE